MGETWIAMDDQGTVHSPKIRGLSWMSSAYSVICIDSRDIYGWMITGWSMQISGPSMHGMILGVGEKQKVGLFTSFQTSFRHRREVSGHPTPLPTPTILSSAVVVFFAHPASHAHMLRVSEWQRHNIQTWSNDSRKPGVLLVTLLIRLASHISATLCEVVSCAQEIFP